MSGTDENLYDENIAWAILAAGTEEDKKKVQEIHNFTDEEIGLFSRFAKLRKDTLESMDKELKEQREKNQKPTDNELSMGVYEEQIEPQVRDAIRNLRKKGYSIYESGFSGWNTRGIGLEEPQLEGFELPQETEKFLKEKDI